MIQSGGPVELMEPDLLHPLPRRPAAAHKGDFGKLFLLAGSEGYTGAPVLAARGPCAPGPGWCFWGCPGRSTPSWR